MDYLIAAAGLVLLVFGGDVLVRGSVAMALRLHVSPLMIGLTVVAFGTSAPELVVSLDAAVIKNAPSMSLGNVVGSNIANVLLVLGVPAMFCSISCAATSLKRDMMVMIVSTFVFIGLCLFGVLTFWSGMILFSILLGSMIHAARTARHNAQVIAEELQELDADALSEQKLRTSIMLIVGGLIGLCIGAHMLVVGAIEVARSLGVSEAAIGLTMVAIGTSLPELATAVAAAIRKHCDVAIGNVIGSNLFNLLGIMGITAMVTDVPVPREFITVNLWVMLATTLMLIPVGIMRTPINRLTGFVFLASYVAYITWVL